VFFSQETHKRNKKKQRETKLVYLLVQYLYIRALKHRNHGNYTHKRKQQAGKSGS
jgi:hypothetical protein